MGSFHHGLPEIGGGTLVATWYLGLFVNKPEDEIADRDNIRENVAEIASGVLTHVRPYLFTLSPWHVSRAISGRVGMIVGAPVASPPEHVLYPRQGPLDKAAAIVGSIASIASIVDMLGFYPQNVQTRVALDALCLVGTVLNSCRAIRDGTRLIQRTFSDRSYSRNRRISNIVAGSLLAIAAAYCLLSSWEASLDLYRGLGIFHRMEPDQQMGVLKSRALHTLSEPKSCSAVVIDGDSSEWGEKMDDVPYAPTDVIYRHCDTRYYRVNSQEQLCHAFEDASKHFGHKPHVASLQGHSYPDRQRLGSNYWFRGTAQETACMKQHLADGAQIIMQGCRTGTSLGDQVSIAQTLGENLPGREVTGFDADYNPLFTSTSYTNGRFHVENYDPLRMAESGWGIPTWWPWTAVRYQYGQNGGQG